MKQRAIVLHGERERVGKAIQNMVDALEKLGYTPELESRLMQRRMELRAIEIGLAEVERMLQGKKLEISDEALHYLGQHVSEALLNGSPDEVHGVLQRVVLRADLFQDRLVLRYVPHWPSAG